jgi:geranylgeranyl diphosphate synthase type I
MFVSSEFEKAVIEIKKVFKARGSRPLKNAMLSLKQEKIECDETKNAVSYFASYWRDIFRPSLVSLACEAVGGNSTNISHIGESLTLLSGATDIHDDLIDKTMKKENRDTVLGKFGEDVALLAGDILFFKGFEKLFEGLARVDIPPKKNLAISQIIIKLYFELCDGEALELKFRGRMDVKPEEYLQVLRKKAADIEICTRAGAMLGEGNKKQVNLLGEYGRLLGLIILLRNDLEDLQDFDIGLNSRIKNESLPLPILYALEDGEKKGQILALLGNREIKGKTAEELYELVTEAGGIKKLWTLFVGLEKEATNKIKEIKNNKLLRLILEATVPETMPETS